MCLFFRSACNYIKYFGGDENNNEEKEEEKEGTKKHTTQDGMRYGVSTKRKGK